MIHIALTSLLALGSVSTGQADSAVELSPIQWSAGGTYLPGRPYSVDLDINAAKEAIEIPSWLLSAAAFEADGKALGERPKGADLTIPAGGHLHFSFDLSEALEKSGAAKGKPFKLGFASDHSDQTPIDILIMQPAPQGLNFMEVEESTLANYHVVMETSQGTMVMEFWPHIAPGHVRNYLDLCYTGFYEGTTFHRVIPGFMIQGGDPTGTGTGSGPRQLQAEFSDKVSHTPGVLSMARSQNPNSASCQFFVMHANSAQLDNQYSAFGKLVSGIEVVNKIVNTPTGAQDRPKDEQKILKTSVVLAPAK